MNTMVRCFDANVPGTSNANAYFGPTAVFSKSEHGFQLLCLAMSHSRKGPMHHQFAEPTFCETHVRHLPPLEVRSVRQRVLSSRQ